jgi:hypothetical protein
MAGLLLRKMSNKNQFLFVYINLVIDNKAQTIIGILFLNQTSLQQTLPYSTTKLDKEKAEEGLSFTRSMRCKTNRLNLDWNQAKVLVCMKATDTVWKGTKNILDTRNTLKRKTHWFTSSLIAGRSTILRTSTSKYIFIYKRSKQYHQNSLFLPSSTGTCFLPFRYRQQSLISSGTDSFLTTLSVSNKKWFSTFRFLLSCLTTHFTLPLFWPQMDSRIFFFLSRAFCSVAFVVNFLTFLIAFWMILVERILY